MLWAASQVLQDPEPNLTGKVIKVELNEYLKRGEW